MARLPAQAALTSGAPTTRRRARQRSPSPIPMTSSPRFSSACGCWSEAVGANTVMLVGLVLKLIVFG